MTLYRSNPATSVNGAATDGPISLGVEFKVTSSGCTLNGFRFFQGAAPWTGTVTAALYLVGGTTQLTTPITVTTASTLLTTASSEPLGSGFGASMAFDGNTGTRWLGSVPSSGTPQWLRVVPGGSQVATGYKITPHPDSQTYSPTAWKFQGSNDGSSWTDLDTRSGVTWPSNAQQTFTFSNSTGYAQYRLLMTANNGATDYVVITELSITGITIDYSQMWREATLSTPYALTSGTNYRAVFLFSSWRPGSPGGAGTTLTSGPLTVPSSATSAGGNHNYATGASMTNPTNSVASNYMLDVIVEQATSGPASYTGTAASVTITAPSGSFVAGTKTPAAFTGAPAAVTVSAPAGAFTAGTSIPAAFTGTPAAVTIAAPAGSVVAGSIIPANFTGTPAALTVEAPIGSVVTSLPTGQSFTGAPATVAVTAPAGSFFTVTSALGAVTLPVGVGIEVGALTLLDLVTLPGTEIGVGSTVVAGDSMPVVPLPGVSIGVGSTLIARPVDVVSVDPRNSRPQWRYVVTDLANMPLGELTDITHDAVEDGVNTPTTMRFMMAADDPTRALIESAAPLTRKCQVWEGNNLLLWGPLLPDQQGDNDSAGYTVHDPSWWWRGGRRVIGRLPRLNLLKNGDFKSGLTYWTRGYDADSKPAAAPDVKIVSEDFLEDTDGLDPIKAAQITGVESFTESELSSNAVFWPNLATFRPGGVASVETVANAMPTTAGLKVTIIGHTANDGTGNGLGLSLRRAQAAAAIVHAKRPGAVITTKGVGFYDPKPGFPIDSQAQRRVVIQYDQTITGESKQWIRQTIEVTQPKSARYPLVMTAAAMLKVADDWSVPDANMVTVKVVARRKGAAKPLPWDAQLGVGESSISDTDPVDRWIGQSAQATVPADGRPYLVDVYLYAPAALADYTAVGLFPEELLYFWGVDQALIFKGIVEHIQSTALGHGDLGIETRTPLTGIKRDRTYAFRDHMPADTALEEFGGLNRGMDYDTRMLTDGRVIMQTYYPQQGKPVGYTLVQGGNVVAATPERSRDVASSIIMQAQDLGSYRAEAYAKDPRALGGLLLEKVVTAEQETPLNELREAARQELAWGRTSTTGYWLDIDPDAIGDVLANTSKGDVVRLILDSPVQVDCLARIVNRERHPDSLRLLVAVEV